MTIAGWNLQSTYIYRVASGRTKSVQKICTHQKTYNLKNPYKIRTNKNPYTAKISDIQEIGTKKCVFWQSLPVPKLSFCIQLCYHSGLTYYKTFFKYLKEPFLPLIMHCVRILFSFQPYNINFSFLPFAINGEKRKVFNILYIH